jgi:hypothetical protein
MTVKLTRPWYNRDTRCTHQPGEVLTMDPASELALVSGMTAEKVVPAPTLAAPAAASSPTEAQPAAPVPPELETVSEPAPVAPVAPAPVAPVLPPAEPAPAPTLVPAAAAALRKAQIAKELSALGVVAPHFNSGVDKYELALAEALAGVSTKEG